MFSGYLKTLTSYNGCQTCPGRLGPTFHMPIRCMDYFNFSENQIPLLIILQFLVAVNSQYLTQPQFRPDLTFGEENERFDVSPLIRYQNDYLKDGSMRRFNKDNLKHKGKWIILQEKGRPDVLDSIKNDIVNELEEIDQLASNWRRIGRDIYPVDQEKEDDRNFEISVDELGARRSLNDIFIKLGGGRRSGTDGIPKPKKTQLDYAVPFDMNINGYLVLPDVV